MSGKVIARMAIGGMRVRVSMGGVGLRPYHNLVSDYVAVQM